MDTITEEMIEKARAQESSVLEFFTTVDKPGQKARLRKSEKPFGNQIIDLRGIRTDGRIRCASFILDREVKIVDFDKENKEDCVKLVDSLIGGSEWVCWSYAENVKWLNRMFPEVNPSSVICLSTAMRICRPGVMQFSARSIGLNYATGSIESVISYLGETIGYTKNWKREWFCSPFISDGHTELMSTVKHYGKIRSLLNDDMNLDCYRDYINSIRILNSSHGLPSSKSTASKIQLDCYKQINSLAKLFDEESAKQCSRMDYPNPDNFLPKIDPSFMTKKQAFKAGKTITGKNLAALEVLENKRVFFDAGALKNSDRIESTFYIGTPTMRIVSKDPCSMSLSKESRRAIVAPEGFSFVIADYAQIELRIAAALASKLISENPGYRNEKIYELLDFYRSGKTMASALINGMDPHLELMKEVMEDPGHEDRKYAKAVNFGLLYGMGDEALHEYGCIDLELDWSQEEASNLARAWERRYSDLAIAREIIKNCSKSHRVNMKFKDEWQNRKVRIVETLGGRKMAADTTTRALNYAGQGTGADIMAKAITYLEISDIKHEVVNVVYDEIVVLVSDEKKEAMKKGLAERMERAALDYISKHNIPVEIDCKASRSWYNK